MAITVEKFEVVTSGKGNYEITERLTGLLSDSGLSRGVVTVFVRHTSASLVIMENADPSALVDLEAYFDRIVPEDADYFTHTYEGSDDMPSHIRMALTRTSEAIPFDGGRLLLGTWQGVFLFEHRRLAHHREIVVTISGE